MRFEKRNVPEEQLSQLYCEYHRIENLVAFIQRARELFPTGNCGLASIFLRKELGGEVVRGSYAGIPHTFLLVNRNVVDITADQYGGPRVYIGPLTQPWAR